MILDVVQYGHPALRERGERVREFTPELQRFIAEMLETMYHAKGVGLAAPQVGRALQLTVVDVRGASDRPSTIEVNGQPASVDDLMPLALVNPRITPLGGPATGPEGCLSFPGIYVDITRPEGVEVRALDAEGRPLRFRCGGLLARAIQHEVDHLNGVLFIDRMTAADKAGLREELDALHTATKRKLAGNK